MVMPVSPSPAIQGSMESVAATAASVGKTMKHVHLFASQLGRIQYGFFARWIPLKRQTIMRSALSFKTQFCAFIFHLVMKFSGWKTGKCIGSVQKLLYRAFVLAFGTDPLARIAVGYKRLTTFILFVVFFSSYRGLLGLARRIQVCGKKQYAMVDGWHKGSLNKKSGQRPDF